MGLYKRKESPYWHMRFADQDGRDLKVSTGTTSKKLAKAILAKTKVEVAEGRKLDKKKEVKTTFFGLCNQYWQAEGQFKKAKGLSSAIDTWKKGIGNRPVSQITPQLLERFSAQRMKEENLSPATRNRNLAKLSPVFSWAIKRGLAIDNPVKHIKKLREEGARTRYLSIDEINRLLPVLDDYAKSAPSGGDLREIALTALNTGMRKGEIFDLMWSDMDLKRKLITVQKSKSGKKRNIGINETIYEMLVSLPSRFKKGHVFPSSVTGKRWSDGHLKRRFKKILAKAEIEDFQFHDLRHTFASHLVINGVDIRTVSELMGHSSITMTMRYAHLAPNSQLHAVQTLASAYKTVSETVSL